MLEEDADLDRRKSDFESCLADVGQDACQQEIAGRLLAERLDGRLDNVGLNVPRDAGLSFISIFTFIMKELQTYLHINSWRRCHADFYSLELSFADVEAEIKHMVRLKNVE